MWRSFYELRISEWYGKPIMVKVMNNPVHPHVHHHITEMMFRKMVQVKLTGLDRFENDIIQPVTESEENHR